MYLRVNVAALLTFYFLLASCTAIKSGDGCVVSIPWVYLLEEVARSWDTFALMVSNHLFFVETWGFSTLTNLRERD